MNASAMIGLSLFLVTTANAAVETRDTTDPITDVRRTVLSIGARECSPVCHLSVLCDGPVLKIRATAGYVLPPTTSGRCLVTFRFDKREPVTEEWDLSRDSLWAYSRHPDSFLRELQASQVLAIRFPSKLSDGVPVVWDLPDLTLNLTKLHCVDVPDRPPK